MNVLILTGRFGMGHYSAAEAVKQDVLLKEPDAKVDIIDMIDYMLPGGSSMIYESFNFMVRQCSGVYNLLNGISKQYSNVPFKGLFIKKVEDLLTTYKPDLVIATLPICAQYISAYKNMKACSIPLYTYITDIIAHKEWIAEHTDRYFVGDESTKQMLTSKGVLEDKIIISGIPVKQVFKGNLVSKVKSEKKEILIMGGGLGLVQGLDDLLQGLNEKNFIHITLIAGTNKKLVEKIKKAFPYINVIGYTEKVHTYMEKADLIITKSGGITTFEAIHCETPLYIIRPFLAQEVGNAAYIERLNMGRVIWSEKVDLISDLLELLEDEKRLGEMQCNMRQVKECINKNSPLTYYYSQRKEEVAC
ncbi:MAG: hypothetical protein KHY44_04715 [Clostridiales bacterium]|jgi:processive 1,2-diacylglycerol beta-glucosyltransferase|nr:hypothetical protein [Clostridiales bacterium]